MNITFEQSISVKNKKIALLSIQYPKFHQVEDSDERVKRIIKADEIIAPEPDYAAALVFCDVIEQGTHVNSVWSTELYTAPERCLDVVHLTTRNDYNIVEIQNPIYHDLRVDEILNLNIQIRQLNGDLFYFKQNYYIVIKLGLK